MNNSMSGRMMPSREFLVRQSVLNSGIPIVALRELTLYGAQLPYWLYVTAVRQFMALTSRYTNDESGGLRI